METVQQTQTAQVQEPTQPTQAEPQNTPQAQTQAEPQGNATLTAKDFAAMSDEDKAKVLAQIELAQNGGQSEPTQSQQPQPTQDNIYSLDEFNAIDLSRQAIDPARLPQVERDIHAKYMEFYNKSILPQLQELQRIKAAQQPQASQQQQPTFNDVVVARAMQSLGVNQLDMQDPRTTLEISKQSTLLAQELQQMQYREVQKQQLAQRTEQIFSQVRNEIKDYDAIDQWGKDEIQNLPLKTVNQVLTDLRSGDYGKVKAVYDFFAQRYAQQHGTAETTQNTENTPPMVIGGSMQSAPEKKFSYDSFAKADDEEQKSMLISSGLI